MDASAFPIAPRRRVWLAPLLAALSAVLLVGLAIAFADRPIADFSYAHLHKPAFAKLLTKLAELPDPLALIVLIFVGVKRLTAGMLSRGERIAAAAGLATVLATIAVLLLKIAFGRLWPETWVLPPNPSWIGSHSFGFVPFHGGKGYESFPSGHTTRVTAPFAVLWHRLPRYRLLWVLPTLAVMLGLLACDFHWLSDCIAGIYLGVASAALVMVFI